MKTQNHLNPDVYTLASNLFGLAKHTKDIKEPKLPKSNARAENTIVAVYPAIIEEAFTITMDKYREYVFTYNLLTCEENAQIRKFNRKVRLFWETQEINDVQREFAPLFVKNNKGLSPREYNKEADQFNEQYNGLLVEKKIIQPIRAITEIIFQNFLHVYNCQLWKQNEEFIRLHVKHPRPIRKMEINSYFITALERNNIPSVNLCSKTIRLHRQRLQEAGVLVDFEFCGSRAAVKAAINPEILTVLDIQTSNLVTAENQRFTPILETKFPDNDETTRPHQKEYKIRENASDSLDKELPTVVPVVYKNQFYKNAGSNQQKKATHPPGANVKFSQNVENDQPRSKTLSEDLRDLIIHPQALAVQLAAHEFDNYTPIDVRLLEKEAYSGTLNRDEFRELIIQDFFKSAAKLYRDATVFPGAWKNAINHWYDYRFKSFLDDAFNKDLVFDDVKQLRWRLEWARKWFVQHQFNRLYPSDYFDPRRKDAKEVGFEYTANAWRSRAAYESKKEIRKRQRDAQAEQRTIKNNNSRKCETQIRRFLKDKITSTQLFDYVRNNLPAEFYEKLPEMILKLNAKK